MISFTRTRLAQTAIPLLICLSIGATLMLNRSGDSKSAATTQLTQGEEETTQILLQQVPTEKHRNVSYGREHEKWSQHTRLFVKLWQMRSQSNITRQIIPFLNDPAPDLREQAANALAMLEHPEGEKPLLLKLQEWQGLTRQIARRSQIVSQRDLLIPQITLKFALGHIRSRNLKGKAKLDKIAEEFGLTLESVVKMAGILRQQMQDPDRKKMREAVHSNAKTVVSGFVNTLYFMGKRGENLKVLRPERLILSPVDKALIQAASATPQERLRLLLDYATSSRGGDAVVPYILDLGSVATDGIVSRLEHIKDHPELYDAQNRTTRTSPVNSVLFLSAVATEDQRCKTLLQQLKQHPNLWIRAYADRAQVRSLTASLLIPN